MTALVTPLVECVACGRTELELVHDFGHTRLANTYRVEQLFPLSVNVCTHCFHMQLGHRVSPDILYSDYVYCSGTSQSSLKFFKEFAEECVERVPDAKTVLDIACNDGTQLDAFKALGLETHGCDPAEGIAQVALDNGHKVFIGLFEDMRFPEGTAFDIIMAENVIAHTSRPLEFMRNAARLMNDKSRMFITTSQSQMVNLGQCDTVYHEHISYFNAHSMLQLVERAGLQLLNIAIHPFHGQSYVFTIGKKVHPRELSVYVRLGIETMQGMYGMEKYRQWSVTVSEKLTQLKRRLRTFRENGFQMIGLCAAAKGISMLNMCGEKLDVLFDTTPLKQGREASGMPIRPFEEIVTLPNTPALFVTLAWNFQEEVANNCARYRKKNPDDVFITC